MFPTRRIPLIFALLLASGCAHYEYDIVRPAELAQHVPEQSDVAFTLGKLDYRLRSFDNYLVIKVYNRSDAPLLLLGDQSTAVDPSMQSHPLRSQTIAPASFIKLILPPLRPVAEPAGPGVGVGVGYVGGWPRRRFLYDPFWEDSYYYTPQYYTIYDGGEMYWDWEGESDVSLTLTFQEAEQKPFSQTFVLHRRRMK